MVSCINEDMSRCKPKRLNMKIVYVHTDNCDPDFSPSGLDALQTLHPGFWTAPDSLCQEDNYVKSQFPTGMIFPFDLPRRNYIHLATANCFFTPITTADPSFTDRIAQYRVVPTTIAPDTMASLPQPLYYGSYNITADTCSCKEVEYVVTLSPMVARMILSLRIPKEFTDVRATVSGTKAGFSPYDSTYLTNPRLITAIPTAAFTPEADTITTASFYTFPINDGARSSEAPKNTSSTASIPNNNTTPYQAPTTPTTWFISFFANLNGKTVMNRFTIDDATVYAGDVFRRTFRFIWDETVVDAGVEVDLDWKPGGSHQEEI